MPPYIPYTDDGPAELVSAIKARRGGHLLNLDRMLLNSPPFAQGWNGFIGTVRAGLAIPLVLQELAICAVASLNRADYEFLHHGPVFLRGGGTEAQLEALRQPLTAAPLFDDKGRTVLALAIEMTRDIEVSAATRAALEKHFSPRDQVELIGVIAAYNMVSRFLIATGIEPE